MIADETAVVESAAVSSAYGGDVPALKHEALKALAEHNGWMTHAALRDELLHTGRPLGVPLIRALASLAADKRIETRELERGGGQIYRIAGLAERAIEAASQPESESLPTARVLPPPAVTVRAPARRPIQFNEETTMSDKRTVLLKAFSGGPLTIGACAKKMGMSSAGVGYHVKALIREKKLIAISPGNRLSAYKLTNGHGGTSEPVVPVLGPGRAAKKPGKAMAAPSAPADGELELAIKLFTLEACREDARRNGRTLTAFVLAVIAKDLQPVPF